MKQLLPLIVLMTLALLAGCAAPAAQEPSNQSEAPASAEPAAQAPEPVEVNESEAVTLTFRGGSVAVQGADEDAVRTDGANVTIRQPGAYILSGSSGAGSVKIKKDTGHVTLVLRNLDLTADGTAAVCCNKGSSLSIVAEAGTVNTLADNAANNADDNPDNADAENAVVKCKDGDLEFSGAGTLNIVANARNGVKGGASDGEGEAFVTVRELTLNVSAVNDGIKSDDCLFLTSGNIRIDAADDAVGSEKGLYIGGTDAEGPVLEIVNCHEGIEAPFIEIASGDIRVSARDDGINAVEGSGNENGTLNILGGTLYVDVAEGDGLDANGALSISGGDIRVFSSSRNDNSPLDSENSISLTGGTVLAVGSAGMAQSPTQAGQCWLSFGAGGGFGPMQNASALSIRAGDKLEILDPGGTVLAETTALRDAGYVFYSSPALQSGTACTLHINGAAALTADAANEPAAFGGMGGRPGGQTPDFQGGPGGMGGPGGQRPEPPEGEMPGDFASPEGMPAPPEGFSGRPGGPGGQTPGAPPDDRET